MKKFIVLSLLLIATIACNAVGTVTPDPTRVPTRESTEAPTVTSTVTLTPDSSPTAIPTSGEIEVTMTPTPDFLATPTQIGLGIFYYKPEQTPEGDEFIEVNAPLVNVRIATCLEPIEECAVVEQLERGTIRKVYHIREDIATGEIWAQIANINEPVKWIIVEPAICNDGFGNLINCTIFRP